MLIIAFLALVVESKIFGIGDFLLVNIEWYYLLLCIPMISFFLNFTYFIYKNFID
jgi:hypothetical protein